MRGEPTIRPDFLRLVRRARDLGYGWVQVQSNGRMFSALPFVRESMNAGMKAAEVSLYGPTAEIHDSIARVGGAFEQTASGIQKLAMEGALQHVNIPVTRKNVHCLTEILEVLESWFVERAQIVMTRPVGEEWPTQSGEAVPVEEAIPHVLKALNEAEGWISTSERREYPCVSSTNSVVPPIGFLRTRASGLTMCIAPRETRYTPPVPRFRKAA